MILFCCASELGPPEDLSAIEVILYYYYYYIIIYYYYYRDLLNKARQHIDCREEPLTECPSHEVTCEDVERQLNKMKNGKRCGPDGVPTEALKHLASTHQNFQCNHAKRQDSRRMDRDRAPSHLYIKTRGPHELQLL